MTVERLFRYDRHMRVITHLDPLADAVAWIRGLRSTGYVQDVLRERHGFSGGRDTLESARAVAAHCETSIHVLEQALGGAHEHSFLPAYFALLNLAKVSIIAGGKRADLAEQKKHGAWWSGGRKPWRNLLNDQVTLMRKGAMPLLYQTLTGVRWPVQDVHMKTVYPFITVVSHEYARTYRQQSRLTGVNAVLVERSDGFSRIEVEVHDDFDKPKDGRRMLKLLTGLHRDEARFVTKWVKGNSDEQTKALLNSSFRRYLLYDDLQPVHTHGRRTSRLMTHVFPTGAHVFDPNGRDEITEQLGVVTVTPISGSRLLMPEELPLLLAFFHLSNVVRYDPERLEALFDSRAAAMLEALSRQGVFRYLLLFWSHFHQCAHFI